MPDMHTYWSTIAPAAPEMYLTAAICAILLIDVFAGGARRPRLTGTLTLLALAIGAWVAIEFGAVGERTVLIVTVVVKVAAPSWPEPVTGLMHVPEMHI